MNVADVMSRPVMSVTADTPLRHAATILTQFGISGLPVTDGAGRPVGMISQADVLVKERRRAADPSRRILSRLRAWSRGAKDKSGARTVGEAMTSPALTIRPDAAIAEAATTMLDNGVGRLVVVEDGSAVAIVTRHDLLRAFARADDELAENVARVMAGFWFPPGTVTVDVWDGEVHVRGEVDSKENAAAFEDALRDVPGVVAVTSKLRWRTSDREFSEVPF